MRLISTRGEQQYAAALRSFLENHLQTQAVKSNQDDQISSFANLLA